MGLDQYAYAVMPHRLNTPTYVWWDTEEAEAEAERRGIEPTKQIAYWRKHPNLQGWMEDLWHRRSDAGAGWDAFNCEWVEVTFDDLVDLEFAVTNDDLPETTGFFFGESQPEDKEDDLEFIKAAREAISCDMQVYYRSWW